MNKYYIRSPYKNLGGCQTYPQLTLSEAQAKLDWLRRRGRDGRIIKYK